MKKLFYAFMFLGLVLTGNSAMSQAITLSATLTNLTCYQSNDGLINLTVTGGSGTISYAWTGPNGFSSTVEDISNLGNGIYSVMVTDQLGATATDTWTITQPDSLQVTAALTHLNCFGDTDGLIDITVSGGTPLYQYTWTGGSTNQDLSGKPAGTYFLTVTDLNSCVAQGSYAIYQPAVLSITGTIVNPSCYQFADGTITTTTLGGTLPYTFLWNGGATTSNRIGMPAGNYTVTVTDYHGCVAIESFVVTDPAPVTGIVSPMNQTSVCSGNVILPIDFIADNYTPQQTSFTWTRNHPEVSGSIAENGGGPVNGTLINNTASSVTVTFTFTPTAIGCQGPDVLAYVTVPPNIQDSIHFVTPILCSGDSATFTVYAYNGTPPYTGTGNYTLPAGKHVFIITDSIGCIHYDTITISEPAPLMVNYVAINTNCSLSNDGSIGVTITGGTPPYTWAWSDETLDLNRYGLYSGSYILTVTDNNLCSNVQEITIGYNFNSPSAQISAPPTICTGYSLPLTVNFTGTPPFTITYTNGYQLFTIPNIPSLTYTFNVIPFANTMYSLLSVQDAHCSFGMITGIPAIVIMIPLPTAEMLPPAAICYGDTATITVNLTGTTPWSLAWNDGTDHITENILTSPFEIKVAPSFNHNYYISWVGDAYCYGTEVGLPVTVQVHTRPTATLSGSNYTICYGLTENLPVLMTGIAPWTLSYTDGTNVTTVTGITNPQYNIVANPGQSTTYSLISIQDNFCSGTVTGQVVITVNPRPVADWIGSLDTICQGSTGTFSINLSGTPPWNLYWYDNAPHTANNIMSSPFTFTATPAFSMTFVVMALSDSNCQALTLGQTLSVFVDNTPTASLSTHTRMCSSTGGDLKVNLTGVGPWRLSYFENNVLHVDSNILVTPHFIHVSPVDSAIYSLSTVEDAYCSGTVDPAFFQLYVYPSPTATINGLSAEMTVCQGMPINVVPDFQSGKPSYTLLFRDNNLNNLAFSNMHQGVTAVINPPAFPGIYSYQLVSLTDSNGCFIMYNTDFTVTVLSKPIANAGSDTIFYLGDSVMLQGSFTEGTAPYTIEWVPGSHLNFSDILDPVAKPIATTTYSLIVTDSNGCAGSDNVTLTVIIEQAVYGYVTYDNSVHTPLNGVKVVLLNTLGARLDSTTTSGSGYYEMSGIPNGNYSLELSTTKPWMLQNATDALAILKHFVQITPLHGIRLLAANVDGFGAANSNDALLVAKRFTGQLTSFNVGDWVFEEVNFTIPDTNYQYDIKGLCIGDANGSSIPPAKLGRNLDLLQIGELAVTTGSTFSIPVKLDQSLTMGAMSLIFNYPSDKLQIESISMPGAGEAPLYNIFNDEIRIAWFSLAPSTITEETPFLILKATLVSPYNADAIHFELSAESELVNADANVTGKMNLIIPKLTEAGTAFNMETMPNPATNTTRCFYSLSLDANVSLSLLDPLGREIKVLQKGMQTAGSHNLDVDLSTMAQGLYFLRMDVVDVNSASHTEILKLNVIK